MRKIYEDSLTAPELKDDEFLNSMPGKVFLVTVGVVTGFVVGYGLSAKR